MWGPTELEQYFEVTDSESKVREFADKLSEENTWGTPSCCVTLSEDFIREYADKINWSALSCHQNMSPQFVKEFQDKIEWEEFCKYGEITGEIIEKVQDKIKWRAILFYHKLDEDIIEKFFYKWDEYDWKDGLLKCQKLSEEFLKRHKEMWWDNGENIKIILMYQKPFSREFRKELLLRHRTLIYEYYNKKYGKK